MRVAGVDRDAFELHFFWTTQAGSVDGSRLLARSEGAGCVAVRKARGELPEVLARADQADAVCKIGLGAGSHGRGYRQKTIIG